MNSFLKWFFIFSFFPCAARAEGKIPASQVFAQINGQTATVQSLLDNLTPANTKLKDLTVSASELNALSGIDGSNVNAANLRTLTAGSNSDADSLHTHASGVGNASTLDNLDSTQFLRADVSDTFEGSVLTLNGDMELASGGEISSTSNGDITLNPNGSGTIALGTSVNTTEVNLSGNLSVSGDINNPALLSLSTEFENMAIEIQLLKEEVRALKNMIQNK